MPSRFFVNAFDADDLALAAKLGLGLEIDTYLWPCTDAETAQKQRAVAAMMRGFPARSFHGTAITRAYETIARMPIDRLVALYDASCAQALFHGVDRIVFHSDYAAANESPPMWIARNAQIWRRVLAEKPDSFRLYLENFAQDTPQMLAQLCDLIGDPRFAICLDTGHAHCNASVPVAEWVEILGARIGHVHLHNNDGLSDRHWPLGRGTLNLVPVLRALQTRARAPAFVLECSLAASLCWLREHHFL